MLTRVFKSAIFYKLGSRHRVRTRNNASMNRHSPANRGQEASADVVVVTRNGQHLSVTPITETLCTRVRRAVHDDQHGCRVVTVVEPLLASVEPPRRIRSEQKLPVPAAGLESIVRHLARKAGRKIVVRWHSPPPPPLPKPDFEVVCLRGLCDQQLLSFVRGFDHGLIRHSAGVDRNWLIAQLSHAYPNRTFVIATASYAEAKRIRKGLYRHAVKSTLVTSTRCPDRPGRVVIGTFAAMGHNSVECNKRHFFICANAAHALGEQAQRCLLQVDAGFRLFGLLPDDRRLSPAEKDWLVAIFGLRETVVPAHGYEEIKPDVVWVPFRRHGAGNVPDNVYEVKRQLIWNNHIRTRQIGRLAKAVKAADIATLNNDFPAVKAALGDERPRRTIVLVDSVNHALSVARRLSGWPIVAADYVDEMGLTGKQRQLLADRRGTWNTGAGMIVTAAGAESMAPITGGGMTVIIWASSGPGLPPIPPAWRMAAAGEAHKTLLVDIDDHHHPILARWTRRRRKAYRDAEWFAPGADPHVERIKQFLAARPERSQP